MSFPEKMTNHSYVDLAKEVVEVSGQISLNPLKSFTEDMQSHTVSCELI